MMRRAAVVLVALLACTSAGARAGTITAPDAAGFTPRVPVSLLAAPAAWFDASRLHMSTTVSVGSGWGTTNALQSTSFMYQFRAPVAMSVTLGNQLGTGRVGNASSFFLQGLDFTWKPSGHSIVRFEYQDLRSPLQYGYGYGFANPYGHGLVGGPYPGW
jgi:hypothetical protein